ncbi:metallophosphoesterase family protein [Deinococcus sp. YIM 134068]|uniref:metallophosphoesterase family protein n=1 Tax=Deinococcus lichenicola TaxID=3118910 RepID=UPI002F94F9F6
MRLAAIYDIHGNLPALEAVFEDIARADVDEVVVGGDVVAGPMPRETLAFLLNAPVPVRFIRGNADREVVSQMQGGDVGAVPEHVRAITRWVARQLQPEHLRLLSSWPATLSRSVDGLGEVLFCHATPRSDTDVFTRLTPEAHLDTAFQNLRAGLVVCGHTHMQFDRRVGHTRVVNAGSVGMPYGEPGASWVLLGPGVEFRRTDYDLLRAAARIRRTGYPEAGAFADRNVVLPPTEAEALEVFTRMERGQGRSS